jgi:hypothetical protein
MNKEGPMDRQGRSDQRKGMMEIRGRNDGQRRKEQLKR